MSSLSGIYYVDGTDETRKKYLKEFKFAYGHITGTSCGGTGVEIDGIKFLGSQENVEGGEFAHIPGCARGCQKTTVVGIEVDGESYDPEDLDKIPSEIRSRIVEADNKLAEHCKSKR